MVYTKSFQPFLRWTKKTSLQKIHSTDQVWIKLLEGLLPSSQVELDRPRSIRYSVVSRNLVRFEVEHQSGTHELYCNQRLERIKKTLEESSHVRIYFNVSYQLQIPILNKYTHNTLEQGLKQIESPWHTHDKGNSRGAAICLVWEIKQSLCMSYNTNLLRS